MGATMRCESAHGTVLVLRKESFIELATEFPKFGAAWYRASLAHERQRRRCLAKLKHGHSYRHLAAIRIQQVARKRFRSGLLERHQLSSFSSRAQPAFDTAEFWDT